MSSSQGPCEGGESAHEEAVQWPRRGGAHAMRAEVWSRRPGSAYRQCVPRDAAGRLQWLVLEFEVTTWAEKNLRYAQESLQNSQPSTVVARCRN